MPAHPSSRFVTLRSPSARCSSYFFFAFRQRHARHARHLRPGAAGQGPRGCSDAHALWTRWNRACVHSPPLMPALRMVRGPRTLAKNVVTPFQLSCNRRPHHEPHAFSWTHSSHPGPQIGSSPIWPRHTHSLCIMKVDCSSLDSRHTQQLNYSSTLSQRARHQGKVRCSPWNPPVGPFFC